MKSGSILEDVEISTAPLESTFFQCLSCIFTLLLICIKRMVIDMKSGLILEDVEISTAPLESTLFWCLSCIFTLLLICIERLVIEMKSGSILEDVEISTAPLEKYLFPVPLVYFYTLVNLYRKNGHGNKEWIDFRGC